mgnify:CR=1 FL=1
MVQTDRSRYIFGVVIAYMARSAGFEPAAHG